MNLGKLEFESQFKKTDEGLRIPKGALSKFENAAAILWEVAHHYGFNLEQCQSAIQALHGQPGKKFISIHFQLTIDREELVISKRVEDWDSVVIDKVDNPVSLGPLSLDFKSVDSQPFQFSQDKNEAIVDRDKLTFPMVWRKWKAGDHFYPMGLEHKKKLSDFLIDNKVSLPSKEFVTVLESGGEIVWVVGHRIDNRFKITPQTRSAISFFLRPHFD
jgi:tRNA(Ile)-lysidine synthase